MESYEMIQNICDLYKPELKEVQEKFYREFLRRFSPMQLDELWEIIMENHCRTSPPTIGELKKFAQGILSTRTIHSTYASKPTEIEIFSTRLGKYSLMQGWASSYLSTCLNDGIPEQTDDILLKFQKDRQKFRDDLSNLREQTNDKMEEMLLRMGQSMERTTKDLIAKYGYLTQNQIAKKSNYEERI